jgi:hypothetical protein
MNNMPGFSADAALYQTSGRYRTAGSRRRSAGGGILPQLPIGFCMADCEFNVSDPFMQDVCKLGCLGSGGGGGGVGGGGGGGGGCRPGCGTCRRVAGRTGRWKTCINADCEDREVRC